MRLETRRLHACVGAEILGVDVTKVGRAQFAAV